MYHRRNPLLFMLIPVLFATAFIRTVLPTPVLIAPTNGSTPPTLRPTFDWTDVTGATRYKIQISTSNTFTSLLMSGSPSISGFIPTKDLPPNINLYWRVQAVSLTGSSAWSEIRQILTANPPTVPLLASPINANINSFGPTLTWSESTNNPAYYQIQIATDSTFTNLFQDAKTSTAHYQLPATALGNLVKYYWRVRAVNGMDQFSSWSTPVWFRSPGQIRGKITDLGNGLGVGGVLIQVKGKNLSGTTDNNGEYTINGVMPGSYTLVPTAPGYRFTKSSLSVRMSSANLIGKNFTASSVLTVSGYVVLDPRANLITQALASRDNRNWDSQNSQITYEIIPNWLMAFWTTVLNPRVNILTAPKIPSRINNGWSLSSSGVSGVTVRDNQGHITSTNQNGNYVINNALPGSYTLKLTKRGYTSIPLNRSFLLSDDALAQYFMVTPVLQPSTTLIYPTNQLAGEYSFSENGRFLFMTNNTGNGMGKILDLYTGAQLSGYWNKGELSGSGRFITFSVAGLPIYNWGVFATDRDVDNNGIFDEIGMVDTWEVNMGSDWSRISTDGRYIVFHAGQCSGVGIHDLQTRLTTCPAQLAAGTNPEISPDGRFISFYSWYMLDATRSLTRKRHMIADTWKR